jgi:hypothetical protein
VITCDTSKFEETMQDLADALAANGRGGDASDIVRDETMRLSVQICRFIPPQTKDIGERAVSRELRSLFTAIDQGMLDDIGSKYGAMNIDQWITTKSGQKLHLIWGALDPTGARMKERHRRAQNWRGKIPRGPKSGPNTWRARVVVSFEDRAAYVGGIIKRVGRWKASWAQVAGMLGCHVPTWIKRHIPTPKGISDITGLNVGEFPSVTFGSRAPNASRQLDQIRSALRVRTEAMKKRIALMASGYAKDVARGMRIRARSKRSGNGGGYVIS